MMIDQALHWVLALVPVLILLAIFISFDAFKLMSPGEILVLLILGGFGAVVSYPVSGRLLDALPIGFSNYSRFYAPWVEEGIKAVIVIGLFRINKVGFKLDAVITGFAVGAGFSVVENIIYLIRLPDYGASTWLVRGLGTAVMHGVTLAIVAVTAHEFAERETREAASDFDFSLVWFVPGYIAAVAIHMVFNQFPEEPLLAMLGASIFAPVAILVIFQFGTAEAQKWLVAERAQHQQQYEALRDGDWPDSVFGRRVGEFAGRFDQATKDKVRRFWELQAWLVMQAEETLLEEAAGDVDFDPDAIRRAFGEREMIEGELGRARIVALNELLPFSRNDYWELSELRQRVDRSD